MAETSTHRSRYALPVVLVVVLALLALWGRTPPVVSDPTPAEAPAPRGAMTRPVEPSPALAAPTTSAAPPAEAARPAPVEPRTPAEPWTAIYADRVMAQAEACGNRIAVHCADDRCAVALDTAPWSEPLSLVRRPGRLLALALGAEDPCHAPFGLPEVDLVGVERTADVNCVVLRPGTFHPGDRDALEGDPRCAAAVAAWRDAHAWW